MIFDTLYKLEAKWDADSTRHCKNHLSFNGGDALCGRKYVQSLGGRVDITNGKWAAESINAGEFTIPLAEKQVKETFCKYCRLMAQRKEADSHAA